MKRTGPTNTQLIALIAELKKQSQVEEAPIWKRLANDLERPTRIRRAVNLSRINRYAKENEVVVIPGKVLGSGFLDKQLTVAAYTFSQSALEKLKKNNCTVLTLPELMKKHPKGRGVRIVG
ncbi:50S ribosomal protein L18e [Candidatus Woesearchaeota archaeon]|nr:MAG: 50S ribosomal protein L18e [Candidatus Woesearchaeota archaeon]